MSEKEAQQLLIKYHAGLCNDAEKALVERWLFSFEQDSANEISLSRIAELKMAVREELPGPDSSTKRINSGFLSWISAAALLLIIGSAGLFFFLRKSNFVEKRVQFTKDIGPGVHSATLTLASGETIQLKEDSLGVVIKATQLAYTDGIVIENETEADTSWRTITTPRGAEYHVELPDGSKILLNAASSLKFPATFQGALRRKVKLSGEAYFEVAKDSKHPFLVETGAQVVEVLGTHFNINSYQDEKSIKTTLLEGSVRISSTNAEDKILKPGQQSFNDGNKISVKTVDTDLVIDWKNGDFVFKNESLFSLMLRISRWYNVDVTYDNDIDKNQTFTGKVSRRKNISEILKALSNVGNVKFIIVGNSVTVKK